MAEFDPQEFLKKYSEGEGPLPTESSKPGPSAQFGAGVVQGAFFDPVEGINQLLEHASNDKIGLPDSVKQELENYKQRYAGPANTVGNWVGTVGSLAIPGSSVVKGAGLVGKGLEFAGKAAVEGPEALGRLARIVRTPPKAAPWTKMDRAASGAGEAKKAFLKGKELPGETVPRTVPKTAEAEEEAKKASTAERVIKGAAGGIAGGAVSPVDESQGDYWNQKGGQVIGGGLGGGALGLPGAAPAAAAATIGASMHKYGFWPTMAGLALLSPGLRALASRHEAMQAAQHLNEGFNKIFQRPGAAYAGARAAAPLTAPVGGAALEQMEQ